VIWLVAAWAMERWALRPLGNLPDTVSDITRSTHPTSAGPAPIFAFAAPFVIGLLAAMAVTTMTIPFLVGKGHRIDQAAIVLAGLGISQLPGRIWFVHGAHPCRQCACSRALWRCRQLAWPYSFSPQGCSARLPVSSALA
ncbi:hypothetical protein PEC18_30225, partial [Paucibacter sp. O1-1]|nr:hypothetical protein [Paucibacter sp. O1-1]MDA3829996.1 hypothetical protein [Paucibacter sp. O1-1]